MHINVDTRTEHVTTDTISNDEVTMLGNYQVRSIDQRIFINGSAGSYGQLARSESRLYM